METDHTLPARLKDAEQQACPFSPECDLPRRLEELDAVNQEIKTLRYRLGHWKGRAYRAEHGFIPCPKCEDLKRRLEAAIELLRRANLCPANFDGQPCPPEKVSCAECKSMFLESLKGGRA